MYTINIRCNTSHSAIINIIALKNVRCIITIYKSSFIMRNFYIVAYCIKYTILNLES